LFYRNNKYFFKTSGPGFCSLRFEIVLQLILSLLYIFTNVENNSNICSAKCVDRNSRHTRHTLHPNQ